MYIGLLTMVVKYFEDDGLDSSAKKSIHGLLDVISSSPAYAQRSREDVEDTVLYVISTCTLLLISSIHLPMAGGLRKVTATYNLRTHGSACGSQPYREDLVGSIVGSGLLPIPIHYLPPNHTVCKHGLLRSATTLSPFLQPSSASLATQQVDIGRSTSTHKTFL